MSLKITREGINAEKSALTDEKIGGMTYELEQMLDGAEITVRVMELRDSARVELSFDYNGYHIRREDQRADVAECLNAAVNSAKKRVNWLDSKLALGEQDKAPIIRTKELKLSPINREKAVTEMKLVDHMFYMFKDEETGKVCTIYSRNNGGYGILIAD